MPNEELAQQAANLSRSTVQVHRGFGGGSGVIWHNGLIVTNAHVVSSQARVELSDGRVFDAECVKCDRQQDLAILRVDATNLPVATIGNSDTLRVGELVLAVGNPLAAVGALTTGIIHAVSPNTPRTWVQADIRLAPGNSGGPLADAQARVIGINTLIAGGLALAVPSNTVERFLRQNQSRPYLGVTLQPIIIPLKRQRVLGLLILEVHQSRPAQTAGLKTGDVLIRVSGQFFQASADLAQALWQINPGDTLQLDFLRRGKYMTCTVKMPDGKIGVEAA